MGRKFKPSVAILASGSGSTAEAFIHATQAEYGAIGAQVEVVVCNRPRGKAGVYDRIDRLNKLYGLDIDVAYISNMTHPGGELARGQTLAESEAICQLAVDRGVAHVALMGYMRIVTGSLVDEFGWRPNQHQSIYEARMTNTHPGPLPETVDTFGINTSARVLEIGMGTSRHTVHLVAPGVDRGPIIAEHPVEIIQGEGAQDLFERVQVVEKTGLPYVLDRFLREQEAYYNCNS